MMFKKVLLPVDLSDRHRQALEAAANLAKQSGGEITLLHIIEVIAGLSMAEERDFYKRLEKKAANHVAALAALLKQDELTWRTEILYGHRVSEVVRYAAKAGVDLIVLTSPRMDANNPAVGWGSLSYKISMLSPCPVLLVK
jgi:nucleotide-binding universal stress UspA family protein